MGALHSDHHRGSLRRRLAILKSAGLVLLVVVGGIHAGRQDTPWRVRGAIQGHLEALVSIQLREGIPTARRCGVWHSGGAPRIRWRMAGGSPYSEWLVHDAIETGCAYAVESDLRGEKPALRNFWFFKPKVA